MDIDMRSESCTELDKVEKQVLAVVKEAVDEENKTRSTKEGPITADAKKIGDRPCGETSVSSPLIQTVTAVVSAFGLKPNYSISSTDSNLPMSLGIPAVTIGRGPGGRTHSLDEFTVVEPKADVRAAQVALAILLAVSGAKRTAESAFQPCESLTPLLALEAAAPLESASAAACCTSKTSTAIRAARTGRTAARSST
jgi:tripeptide aminopeptidase